MNDRFPSDARLLGFAGLLPQAACLIAAAVGGPQVHFTALAMGYAYAAFIFSFVGGMWWGLASAAGTAPRWLWLAAVVPSLLSLLSFIPWTIGEKWPGPSLIMLAVAIAATLVVDRRLAGEGLAPPWWMTLRMPLSLGLAGLTLALGIIAG